jgi:hypothetical protein
MGDISKGSHDVLASQKDDRDIEQAVFAPQDPAEKDNELVAVTTTASERLPFSKVRSIAIVATVSAAPFLTVRRTCEDRMRNTDSQTQTFNTQASIITLPTIGEALNIPANRQQWIVSAYNLTFGCFLVSVLRCFYNLNSPERSYSGVAWLTSMDGD